jgi:homoserine O-acetyltransferase/O-succinyltransferase
MFMRKFFLTLIVLLTGSGAYAQELSFFKVGDFQLESGDTLYDCRIGYRTFGSMNEDSSNVILYPTWFGGSSASLANLIGPDKLIDDSEYFIIAVDALGNGISTSPSNSREQGGVDFPVISIGDMVRTQYLLLTERFGLRGMYGIIGGSMGGMQAFEWLVAHPGFAERAVIYVASPQLSPYDLLVMNTRKEIVDKGRTYRMTERDIMHLLNLHEALLARTPGHIHRNRTREGFDEYLQTLDRDPSSTYTVDNYYIQLKAMIGHDVARTFNGSIETAASVIRSDVLIIVSETDHLIYPAPAIAFAEMLGAGISIFQNDCGHLAPGCEFDTFTALVRAFFTP